MAKYPGESEGKRGARLVLYLASTIALEGRVVGDVLTLAGPGASEYEALRYLAKRTSGQVFMADTDASCVSVAKRAGADRVHHGCVVDLLAAARKSGRRFAFIHLDFMGHVTGTVMSALTAASRALSPGGVVAVTFLRGREMSWGAGQRNAMWHAQEIATGRPASITLAESARMSRWYQALVGGLAPPRLSEIENGSVSFYGSRNKYLHKIADIRYSSGHSPMGVIAVRVMNGRHGENGGVDDDGALYRHVGSLRKEVESLFWMKKSTALTDLIVAATGVSRGTLAAWRAVNTASQRRTA